jgi:hypothetical protein
MIKDQIVLELLNRKPFGGQDNGTLAKCPGRVIS